VVVADIEPLLLPSLVEVDQILQKVLPNGIPAHLYSDTSNYSRVIHTQLRLHPKELLE
jgi:hypothetical protein